MIKTYRYWHLLIIRFLAKFCNFLIIPWKSVPLTKTKLIFLKNFKFFLILSYLLVCNFLKKSAIKRWPIIDVILLPVYACQYTSDDCKLICAAKRCNFLIAQYTHTVYWSGVRYNPASALNTYTLIKTYSFGFIDIKVTTADFAVCKM